jgi:hypothetical protein
MILVEFRMMGFALVCFLEVIVLSGSGMFDSEAKGDEQDPPVRATRRFYLWRFAGLNGVFDSSSRVTCLER